MTLNTSMMILDPFNPEATWAFLNERLIHHSTDWPEGKIPEMQIGPRYTLGSGEDNWVRTFNHLGQGLCAALDLDIPIGGEPADYYLRFAEPDDDFTDPRHTLCYGMVSWDTTYGYRDDQGRSCSDLHRELTAELGAWLDEQGIDWLAQNEFSGRWAKCPMPDEG